MLNTTIQVKTQHFDGPLALLLSLIQKGEMDIQKLDLTKITRQYLTYLSHMRELNFDIAGDYLFLAATLLLLKSKRAMSEEEMAHLREQTNASPDLEIASEAQLIRRLEELQSFQKKGRALWELPKLGHETFARPRVNRKAIVDSILTPVELQKLTMAMWDLMIKEKQEYTVVHRDRLSIKEKLLFLKSCLQLGLELDFKFIVEKGGGAGVSNTVMTFISLLELARLKRINIFQEKDKGEIRVKLIESLEDFDMNQANGFEEGEQLQSEAL